MSEVLKVFIGVDHRQPISYHVLASSISRRSSKPVSITPLFLDQLPIVRRGLTEFTFARYLVPWLCDFKGWALFVDSDMLVLGDIVELFDKKDPQSAVQVVQRHQVQDYQKGTVKDDPLKFEWPSVMLFNNKKCKKLTPEYVDDEDSKPFKLNWGPVGELPPEWNHLVLYDELKPAKLIHYTAGIPHFKELRNTEYSSEWHDELEYINQDVSWMELHGPKSVHWPTVITYMQSKGMI